MQEGAIHILSNTDDDRKLVLDFLYMFSRFEYALKRADFFYKQKHHDCVVPVPAWDRYAVAIKGRFGSDVNDKFRDASKFLECVS